VKKEPADTMLICDVCDQGFHCECIGLPVTEIPEGEWICDECKAKEESSPFSLPRSDHDITNDDATLHYLQHKIFRYPSTPAYRKRIKKRATRYFFRDGKLYFRPTAKFDEREVPAMRDRTDMISSLHQLGHLGIQRTANLVQERYFWTGIFTM
jgi:hypothetical protein